MTFWHSQKGVSKEIQATARNVFPGAPEPQVLYTFSFGMNWCPSNLKNAPTGLGTLLPDFGLANSFMYRFWRNIRDISSRM